VNEIQAAALSIFETQPKRETNFLLFDLGGSNSNTAVFTVDEEIFEIKAVNGLTHIGGEDFDEALVRHCVDDIKAWHGVNIWSNHNIHCKLVLQCKEAKWTLTTSPTAEITCKALLPDGSDYTCQFTREQFDEINHVQFNRAISTI